MTDTNGTWSETVAGTPAEPGDAHGATAVDLPLDVLVGGEFDTLRDVDYFKFTLAVETGVVLMTHGDLDTDAEVLYDEDGDYLTSNDDGHALGQQFNFLIVRTLDAGTYYVRVGLDFASLAPASYTIRAKAIVDTTGISDADEVGVGAVENGLIDPEGDEDYFQFTLDEETDVLLRAGPPVTDTASASWMRKPRWTSPPTGRTYRPSSRRNRWRPCRT